MSNPTYSANSHKASAAIIDDAAEWVVRLQSPNIDNAEKQAFTKWLQRSPLHVREYLRAEAVWANLERVDPQRNVDVEAVLREATNVVELAPGHASSGRDSSRRMPWPKWLGVAASVVVVGLLSWFYLAPETLTYQTGLGEQRRVVLADGSVVELNTQTEIEVELGLAGRRVRLREGEALFKVAKDPQRPFVVFSDQANVQVVGTEFNVYQKSDQVIISVLEGGVIVRSRDLKNDNGTEPQAIQLTAGYEVQVRSGSGLAAIPANTERVTAWRGQRLIFENTTLANAVSEFNRYNRKQLIILDPMLKAQQINGVFDAGRPEALMRFLVQYDAARVVTQTDKRIVLESVL